MNKIYFQQTIEQDYEPTQQQVQEYAVDVLGLSLSDSHLFYLAKKALCQPMHSSWRPFKYQHSQEVYYQNKDSNKIISQHPVQVKYKKIIESMIEKPTKAASSSIFQNLLKKAQKKKQSVVQFIQEDIQSISPIVPASPIDKAEQIQQPVIKNNEWQESRAQLMKILSQNLTKQYQFKTQQIKLLIEMQSRDQLQSYRQYLQRTLNQQLRPKANRLFFAQKQVAALKKRMQVSEQRRGYRPSKI